MGSSTINAALCSRMFLAGANNLEAKKEWINELNVFPVPDGDTGTNMSLTIMSAAKEVASLDEDCKMDVLSKAISSGSLRGARGNSGVILSQLLRGFTKGIKGLEEIDIPTVAEAFQKAVATAYKAVMKPKEGTILTVAKGAADKASELAATDISMEDFLGQILAYSEEVLAKTPDMLPVLKEAGVVDSGGQGLVEFFRGAYDAYLGKEINYAEAATEEKTMKHLYCVSFDINCGKEPEKEDVEKYQGILEGIGEDGVVFKADSVIRVHIHTNDPGVAITKACKLGTLSNVSLLNRTEEGEEGCKAEELKAEAEKAAKPVMPHKEVGFISVSIGDGIGEIFRGLGVDYLIEGGQTMNPSTEDMLNAIDQVNADTIYIMPNNKNIILAANQAQSLVEDKNIIVVPTKTVPQGISSIIAYDPGLSADENLEAMKDVISSVKTGQVTYAVRDTRIDDKDITMGDIMGIGDSGILAVGKDILGTAKEMISCMADEDTELISIYYGADVTEEDANVLLEAVQESYPDSEVELYMGGQPIYYYVVSVE